MARLRQAATAGTVHYSCLEPAGGALCVAAERPTTLVLDSERPADTAATTADTGSDTDTATAGSATADAAAADSGKQGRACFCQG